MSFHDNINELVDAFKHTPEYVEYLNLKEEIKKDKEAYLRLKDFKDKQNEVQIGYLNGQEVPKEKQQEMANLYSIVIQNETSKKILESEMKINILLADLQKELGTAVEELIKF